MERITTSIVQKCQLGDTQFSKAWFDKKMSELTPEQFDLFCREIMHLNQHYDTTVGLYVTDQYRVSVANPDLMWYLDETDFNSPITFKKIQ